MKSTAMSGNERLKHFGKMYIKKHYKPFAGSNLHSVRYTYTY